MMDPRDVFACLTYLSKGDLSRIGDELVNGEKIPGWYVRAERGPHGHPQVHAHFGCVCGADSVGHRQRCRSGRRYFPASTRPRARAQFGTPT